MDRRVRDDLHPLTVLNPLGSEQEAFRFLLYVAGTVAVIVLVVLIIRAL